MTQHKEVKNSLQILLWLWFGLVTSFVFTNVVNIAKLETEVNNINQKITDLQTQVLLLENKITK